MPVDPLEFDADDNLDRRLPQSRRADYSRRKPPTASRPASSKPARPPAGFHKRHRKRYGL